MTDKNDKKANKNPEKVQQDPNTTKAFNAAEEDILADPELSDSDPTDDLDEGELARKDNSDEEAFDNLENKHSKKEHGGN
jgi:hypothetical protein